MNPRDDVPLPQPSDSNSDEAQILEDFDGVRPSLNVIRTDSLAHLREHARSDDSPFRGRRSEFIWLVGNRGGERILAVQDVAPVAVISELEIRAWVRGNRAGFQMMVRVRLPRSLDDTGEPLSLYVLGDRYTLTERWQQLRVSRFETQLDEQVRAMRAQRSEPVDATQAYVDQVAFNLFGGAGVNRFWVDDLSLFAGIPVRTDGKLSDNQVALASYSPPPLEQENWLPRVAIFRGQPLEDIARAGFNAVWFSGPATIEQLNEAEKRQLRLVCEPPEDLSNLGRYTQVAAWLLPSEGEQVAIASAKSLQLHDSLRRPVVGVSPSRAWHDIRLDRQVQQEGDVDARRWLMSTTDKVNRWLPIRNRLREAVFQGYTGFTYDSQAISPRHTPYQQSLAELFNLELSMLQPWIERRDSLERWSQNGLNTAYHVTGMFSRHAGLIWVRRSGSPSEFSPYSALNKDVEIPDALYREVYYVEPGSLEPARNQRIPGGVRISLTHDKPQGLLLLSNQPQVLRAHKQFLKSIGPRYNELLVKVIRHELLALDRELSNAIDDAAHLGHLRHELHALQSRIAPVLDSHESLVSYRQLDHLLGQLERVQRLTDVRF